MLLVRTVFFLVCTVALMAQTDTDQSATPQPASGGEYSGPAILSRGQTPAGQTAAPLAFRPYIGLNGIYDTGIVPVGVTSQGTIPTADEYGVELSLGGYLYHASKDTTVGLDYRGDFRHYTQNSSYDGTDQFLSLIVTNRPSRHWTFTMRDRVGLYSLNTFIGPTSGAFDPAYLQAPVNNIFDNRLIFGGVAGDLTYQKSARLSFNFGGEGNLTRYQSTALYGSTGATARADMEYRMSRHTTLGVDYRYTYYAYTRGFGNTGINSVGLNYSTQFTRHLQLSARIGGARVTNLGLTEITLPPAIAVLLGESVAIQAAKSLTYSPDLQARLTETWHRSSFSVGYTDMITPGNGLYVATRNNQGIATYSYSGLRHWNFSANASYGRMTSLSQELGAYNTYTGGVGLTRDISKGLHAVVRLDAIHYKIGTAAQTTEPVFDHNEYRMTVGFTFSPGDIPLVLW